MVGGTAPLGSAMSVGAHLRGAGGTALGVRAVTILSRTISDTRPLRHLVWTLIAEADAPRPQEPTVWAMDDPTRLDAARDGARVRVITADHLFED